MRLLVTNLAPCNGGDEALGRAIVESITAQWPDVKTTVLCKDVDACRTFIPGLTFDADLDDLPRSPLRPLHRTSWFVARATRQIPGVARIAYTAQTAISGYGRRHIENLYRQADVIASAPGGFLSDHYQIAARLDGLAFAVSLGKPVMTFPQSFGPFWKPETLKRIPKIFNQLRVICARDEASRDHLISCGVERERILLTADAAFLWRQLEPQQLRPGVGSTRRVGLCFREWPFGDQEEVQRTVSKATALCKELLADPDRTLHFISTCQGIPGYVDDSQLARRIVNSLPPADRNRCIIDSRRHTTRELLNIFADLDAFIGMRLHCCILAMLAGTPAMGLAYERKTAEIFGQLGLSAYQVPFVAEVGEWIAATRNFVAHHHEVNAALPAALDDAVRRASLALDAFATCSGLNSKQGAA